MVYLIMMQKMYITKVKHTHVVHLMKVTLICLGKNQQIIKKMGKGSKIKGLGSSWMKQHATNLLKYMPVDDIASGKGPGKHGVHKSMAKHGEPKGQGPGTVSYTHLTLPTKA